MRVGVLSVLLILLRSVGAWSDADREIFSVAAELRQGEKNYGRWGAETLIEQLIRGQIFTRFLGFPTSGHRLMK